MPIIKMRMLLTQQERNSQIAGGVRQKQYPQVKLIWMDYLGVGNKPQPSDRRGLLNIFTIFCTELKCCFCSHDSIADAQQYESDF